MIIHQITDQSLKLSYAMKNVGLASPAWLVVMLTDVYCGE